MLSVHSEKAFETVEQVYQASQSGEASQPEKQQGGSCRGKAPQFASLVQVEGGQQHLLVDQHNPLTLARRPSTDLLPLVPAALNEDHFQLVDNLPSIYFV